MREVFDAKELESVIEDVRKLVKEEQKKEGLKCPTTDEFLLRFIKTSCYDVTKSFQLIRSYFKVKIEEPECFVVQSPAKYLKRIQRTELGVPLRNLDKGERRVLHFRLGKDSKKLNALRLVWNEMKPDDQRSVDPSVEDWVTTVQGGLMLLETCSFEEIVQDKGLVFIVNCTNYSMKMMRWATPKKLKVMVAFLQDCLPIRFEYIHIVNYPFIFHMFFAAAKPFMHEEVKKKFVWHSSLCSLHDYIDRRSLPIELGGYLEDAEDKDFYKEILKKEELYAELRQMGYKKK